MAVEGLITIPSHHGPEETMNRLEATARIKGLTIFAQIDHAAGAAAAGLALRPTEVIVLGNAKSGTPLMQSAQSVGIDLPLKVLVWQDEEGRTWLSYNDPEWLSQRHNLAEDSRAVVNAMKVLMREVVSKVTSP